MIGSHTGTPEAYLKQFARDQAPSDRKPKVWTYQKGSPPFAATPDRIGKENGYFAVTKADGTTDESMEAMLASLESRGAGLLPILSYETYVMSSRDAETLKAYIALLFARTSARRILSAKILSHIRRAYEELSSDPEWLREQSSAYERFSGAVTSTESISLATKKVLHKLARPEHVNNGFVEGLLRIAEGIFTDLSDKPIQIWESPESALFITTDNPVITFTAASGRVSIGCGFRTPGATAVFPLSPRCCVLIGMGVGYRKQHWRRATQQEVMDVNQALIRCMDRWAYSIARSKETEQLVNAIGGSLTYGVDVFVPGWMKNATEEIKAKVRSATFPDVARIRSAG